MNYFQGNEQHTLPSGRKHPTHAHCAPASLPILAPSPWRPLAIKGSEEEEKREEEHPQHGQAGEGGGVGGGDARPCGLKSSVPLGEDGLSGPAPLPWAHQPKLVGAAGAEDDL